MARLMSVALTTDQVRRREKTVTRRVGWTMIKPGDQLTLCPKVRGRRRGEPLERIVTVEVVSVRREPLAAITVEDTEAEGFPHMTPGEFVDFFCATHKGVFADTEVSRIEWAYPSSTAGTQPQEHQASTEVFHQGKETRCGERHVGKPLGRSGRL